MCLNVRPLTKNFHSSDTGSRDTEFSLNLFCTHYIVRCSQYFALQFVTLHGFHSFLSSIVFSGYAWKRSRTHPCTRKAHMNLHAPESPHVCVENDSCEFPTECDLVLRQIMHVRTSFSGSPCLDLYIFVTACSYDGMVCRWNPCWVLIDDTFKKAYFEDWQL